MIFLTDHARVEYVAAMLYKLCDRGLWKTIDLVLLDRMNLPAEDADSATVMLMILTITSHAKPELANRTSYLRYAERRLRYLLGHERAEMLLEFRR